MTDRTASVRAQPGQTTRRMPCLVVVQGVEAGKVMALASRSSVIGSASAADIRLEERGVSRRHVRVLLRKHLVGVEDLGSTNGSWVNGQRIRKTTLLKDGDSLQLGACRLALRFQDPQEKAVLLRLYQRATRDSLTGLLNRASLEERLGREIQRHLRYARGLALIQFDLDHFKRINDGFGHEVGDRVLKAVCSAVKTRLRRSDCCGRMGGEEFLVLMPETDLGRAGAVAEDLRRCVAGLGLVAGNKRLPVSASFGVVASGGENTLNSEVLTRAVDKACYMAKEKGRDCVVCL